ncbi:unnamed protein product [Trichogramma brassicae]|uniref:Uncharacterized protein n=1 Tax=Trichogramma brassicae TaxID=86971 RepID=A0A6H5IAG7_9HYME|nr:unnamed protein product [Trichogramma brassicae]
MATYATLGCTWPFVYFCDRFASLLLLAHENFLVDWGLLLAQARLLMDVVHGRSTNDPRVVWEDSGPVPIFHLVVELWPRPQQRIFEVRFFAWCGRACARGGADTTQKEDPGYVISLRSGKKTPITVRAGSDRITISRSPRRGLTKLAIDGAQHSHDEVRSENHTHKRAPDAGAKAQLERMMAPEARTTLTR